jgi:exopolysaccharide biosynthesis polyprenyl glycosylphosphotransferase
MKNNASFIYSLFLVILDAVTLIAAFVGAYILRVSLDSTPIARPVESQTYLTILLTLIPFWIIIFGLIGLYNRSVYDKRFQEIGRLFVGTVVGTLFIIGYAFFSNEPIFPAKLVPIYGFIFTFVLLVVMRNLSRFVRKQLFAQNVGINNVLLVGNTAVSYELVESLADPKTSGYRIIGMVGGKPKGKIRHFENFADAVAALKKRGIHSIMQTELFPKAADNNEILSYAQNNHVAYRFVPGNAELFVGNIDVELFQSSIPMIAVHQTALVGWGRIGKRLFDLAIGLLLTILFLPFMLIIAIINFVSDPGPIFFRQKRVTRYNKIFKIYKFRTMKRKYNGLTPEAAFKKMGKPELAEQYRDQGDQLENDPRVTWFGRFLRKTSLDELPQIFNVLRGDISLVGPRAIIPAELDLAEAKQNIVSVKSGVTGLAQVSGRRNISPEERRKLDLYYVQNWSFWLDIVILFKTLRVILSGRGTN